MSRSFVRRWVRYLGSVVLAVLLTHGVCAVANNVAPAGDRPPELTSPEVLIRSARDLLRLYGMDDARLTKLADDAPLIDEQYELLLRMLYAARRFSLADQRRYVKQLPAEEWLKTFKEQRGELLQLRGQVVDVRGEKPEGKLADRFDMPVIYRCEVLLDDKHPAVIYTLHVPKAWQERGDDEASFVGREERIGALGFATRLLPDDKSPAGEPQPLFVAQRLAWYPHTPLGDIEADAGLFEKVQNNGPMESSDSASFYDVLSACGRVGTRQLLRMAPVDSPVEKLFPRRDKQDRKKVLDPLTERGELISLVGTAQRAVMVRIEDADTIAAYGFDHYYEIELWHANAQGNPLVFCMRKLPEGFPVGERIAVDVTMAGFFFKTWAYRINKVTDGEEKSRFQIAPLMIGREPVLVPREPVDPLVSIISGSLFALAVAGAWIGIAWSQREQRRFRERVVQRVADPSPSPPNFDLEQFDHGVLNFHNYGTSAPLLASPSEDQVPQIDVTPRATSEDKSTTEPVSSASEDSPPESPASPDSAPLPESPLSQDSQHETDAPPPKSDEPTD